MQDVRSKARTSLQEFVSAWLGGNYEAVAEACSPTVRWWTPLSDKTATGPDEAFAALERVLAPIPRPIEVSALVVAEDGSRGVVEMRARTVSDAGTLTLVTSVIAFSAGTVAEGRTYVDLTAHGEGNGASS